MKKLKDLKIEESSEEVKGEGAMQWGGDYVSFLLLSWFRVEPGVDLSKQNHEGLSSQCRCSSMQIWFCGWGGGGGADSHHPPHLFNNSFNPLSPSRSWYISSHLHVFTHRYVLIHTSLFLSNLCLLSLTLLFSIFTHKDFQTSRSTCVFLPLSLSHSLRYSRLYRPLLNGQISAEKKGGCELPLRLCLYWPTIWAGEEKERGWEGNVSPQSFLRNSTAPKNMCSLVNPLTRWLSLILYQTIKNETTAAVGGTALRSKTDSRKMKWASGHGRAEPKIQSLSPLYFFFSHPSLPVVLWSWLSLSLSCSVHHCQATVTLNQSDSRSVVKLFGRATCATRLLQFGCRRPSDTPTAAGRLCSLQFSGLQESKTQIRVKEKP